MILSILRGIFIVLVTAVTSLYVLSYQSSLFARAQSADFATIAATLLTTMGVALVFVVVDVLTPNKKLWALSGVFLGLIAGLVAAYAGSFMVDLAAVILYPAEVARREGAVYNLFQGAKVVMGLITCYLSISLVLQTKDDFRFVIPYVEFAREIRGTRPIVVDTSVLIDGRILDLARQQFLPGPLIVPKFVLMELQTLADSSDKMKRAKGRRGLEVLNKLQHDPLVDLSLEESDVEGAGVDQKLMTLVQQRDARLMTNDFNLAKVAAVRKLSVLNLHDLSLAFRPVAMMGDMLRVKVMKAGEGANQGVGYLEDGTMVVVENGKAMIGEDVQVTVTSTLQTSAGRMIFGKTTEGGNGH